MLAFIKPCGIVVSMTEMFTAESLSQVFLFILTTYCKETQSVDDFQRLRYVGYNRACQLHPYLKNQAKNGSAGAQILLGNVEFLVDKFHCGKHTSFSCMPLITRCANITRLFQGSRIFKAQTQLMRARVQTIKYLQVCNSQDDAIQKEYLLSYRKS